jgi:hypothetical protein
MQCLQWIKPLLGAKTVQQADGAIQPIRSGLWRERSSAALSATVMSKGFQRCYRESSGI